jgi:hypothetical protein
MNNIYKEVLDNSVSILDDLLATDEDNFGETVFDHYQFNDGEFDDETLYPE